MEPAFPFVHVADDGRARELTASERAVLSAEHAPDDDRRPYVKTAYGSRDGQGRTDGFLRRADLPAGLPVRPAKRSSDAASGRRLPFETHRIRSDTRFPYVYVNTDGSVREVSPGEQAYLTAEYSPGDGNRPYIKDRYGAQTPQGFVSGFMHRARLPNGIPVRHVNPRFDEIEAAHREHPVEVSIREAREVGDLVTRTPDGTVSIAPNPEVPTAERVERYRQLRLALLLQREAWARHPDDAGGDVGSP